MTEQEQRQATVEAGMVVFRVGVRTRQAHAGGVGRGVHNAAHGAGPAPG